MQLPPQTTHLVLEGERPPSWNTYYAGQHWSARSVEVARVRLAVRAAMDPAGARLYAVPVTIMIVAYFKDHPQDADNIASKLYIDGLKDWFLTDDGPAQVVAVETRSRVDRDRPRVEVFIIPGTWDEEDKDVARTGS